MMSDFLQNHWFDLLQSLFIITGFILAAITFRSERRSRKLTTLLTLRKNRNEVWNPIFTHPELARIRHKQVDLVAKPITAKERQLVQQSITHLHSVFQAIQLGDITAPPELERDVRQFFSLPIPKVILEEVKAFQADDFIKYINQALNSH